MNDQQYLQHSLTLLQTFADELVKRTENLDETDSLRELALAFMSLAEGKSELYSSGRSLVERLFTTYPDFSPTFPRDLLWFLGGDCLHFMPDEEIQLFQQLDERRDEAAARGEIIDFAAARAKLMKLQ